MPSLFLLLVGVLAITAGVKAGVPNPAADLNADGVVNVADRVISINCFRAAYLGNPLPPECPAVDPHPEGGGDGDWDVQDMAEVAANLGQTFAIGDTTPPLVAITSPVAGQTLASSPVDIEGTVDDSYASIALEVANGGGTQTVAGTNDGSGTYDVFNVPLAPGLNTLTVTATDLEGNVGTASIDVTYSLGDSTPPSIDITTPADGVDLTVSPITVSGTIEDDTSVASVTVNGVTAVIAGNNFSAEVPLSAGANTLTATAIDAAGNSADASVTVTYTPPDTTPPNVSIDAPADGAELTATPITVVGTVSDDRALAGVSVNGIAAVVAGNSFSVDVALSAGANTLTATATDAAGNQATADATVTYTPPDTTPPVIGITTPTDGAELTESPVTVTGTVSDDRALASVTVNGVPAVITGGSFSADVPLSPGSNALTAVATDAAGNSASVSVAVTYTPADTTPPTVSITTPTDGAELTESPATVIGTVSDDRALADVTVNGIAALVTGNSFSVDIALTEGANTLTALATDAAGNTASSGVTVTYVPPDTAPPEISIGTPADGSVVTTDTVTVAGIITDASPIDAVDVNGIAAVLSNGTFSALDIPLAQGSNTITVTATDAAGINGTATVEVIYSLPPEVTITAPAEADLVSGDLIDVIGTVDDDSATVVVNGVAAPVASGQFTVTDLPLDEGYNTFTAVATNTDGVTGSDSVQVRRDTTQPMVTIEVPRDGAVLTSLQADVAGLVNDQSTNINIDEEDVTVTVNGVPAMISQRAWVIPDMLLQRGVNTLEVVATDAAGNSRTTSAQVTVQTQAGQRLVMMGGNAQMAEIGSQLPRPVTVALLDANGDPVPDMAVDFEVTRGEGQFNTPNGDVTQASVRTDDNGLASIYFTVGNRAGAGNHRVRATATGFVGEVEYCFAALAAAPVRITTVAGDQQVGIAGQPLGMPLKVLVNDAGGNPAEGVDVTFDVTAGGGNIDGADTALATTDNDGYASVELTLGTQVGVNNNTVVASFDGLPESPATFSASARLPAEDTSFAGLVVDNQDNPVEGATVRLLPGGAPTDPPIETVTDNQGRFLLEAIPAGRAQLIVDGSTANRPGDWIKLTYEVDVIAGIVNGLGMSVYLLPVGENATIVQNGGPAQDITLTMADIPGAEVTIKANSVTCPPGLSECVVSWTQINAERMAMPPPMGSIVMLGWTLQPTGTKFNPPVDICIPNMDMPPGMQVEMFNWDYGLMDWATVGTATITEDGAQLCSDPGFGIPAAGWGCCVPPPPPCTSACNDCGEAPVCNSYVREKTECGGCTCSLEPTADGAAPQSEDVRGDCSKPVCRRGAVMQEPDDQDVPEDATQDDCKRPICEQGTIAQEPDDSDISDFDSQCRRCADGNLEPDPAKEGASCDDDEECTAEDVCEAGTCTGTAIQVSISPTWPTLCVGRSKAFGAVTTPPGRRVVWLGSGSAATVSASGTVTAVTVGNATVTATDSVFSQAMDTSSVRIMDQQSSANGPGSIRTCLSSLAYSCLVADNIGDYIDPPSDQGRPTWVSENFESVNNPGDCRRHREGSEMDAATHAYLACRLYREVPDEHARQILDAHENDNPDDPCESHEQDYNNNSIGERLANEQGDCTDLTFDALNNGKLQVNTPFPSGVCKWTGNGL